MIETKPGWCGFQENRFFCIITLPETSIAHTAPETLRLEDESVRQTQEFVTARIFTP